MPLREGTFGLALALQAQGRAGEADAVVDRLADALLRTANAGELARVGAFRVRLALLRGELAPARRWLPAAGGLPAHWLDSLAGRPAADAGLGAAAPGPGGPVPAAALADALADVDALLATTERLHLVTWQAQALALRALAQHASGAADAAFESLARALDLGEPGGLARTFADLGPALAALLRLLVARGPDSAYRQRVLAACVGAAPRGPLAAPPAPPAPPRPPPDPLVESLSGRELEVLDRLRRRWLNKEIAADLHVSPETVKSHTAHIYAKLGVGDRRRGRAPGRRAGPPAAPLTAAGEFDRGGSLGGVGAAAGSPTPGAGGHRGLAPGASSRSGGPQGAGRPWTSATPGPRRPPPPARAGARPGGPPAGHRPGPPGPPLRARSGA